MQRILLRGELIMSKIMKPLNNISRAQSVFRTERISGLCASHHTFVLAVCKNPGRSQEELARELCLNKSTVARVLTQLEEKGLVIRKENKEDKRQFLVYPSEKMLEILPKVREIAAEFNRIISSDIPKEEMDVFYSVLSRIEQKAKSLVEVSEDGV